MKTTVDRVKKHRDALRAAGLRPVQIWAPDVSRPGFAQKCSRTATRGQRLCSWTLYGLVVLCGVCVCRVQVFAHHGTAIYYDIDKPIKLTGTVIEFRWANPHAQIYFEVKDAKGHPVTWAGELNSTNAMTRAGWNKRMLKAGDRITVTLFPAKIGTPIGVIDQSKGVIINGKPLKPSPPPPPSSSQE